MEMKAIAHQCAGGGFILQAAASAGIHIRLRGFQEIVGDGRLM